MRFWEKLTLGGEGPEGVSGTASSSSLATRAGRGVSQTPYGGGASSGGLGASTGASTGQSGAGSSYKKDKSPG